MKQAEKEIKYLTEYLSKEIQLYKSLIRQEEQKRDASIADDLIMLVNLTKQEVIVLEKINMIEKARNIIVEELREKYFSEQDEITLTEIAMYFSDAGRKLSSLGSDLRLELSMVTALNNINKRLINDHLSLINLTLGTIQGSGINEIYTENGREQSQNGRVLYNLTA